MCIDGAAREQYAGTPVNAHLRIEEQQWRERERVSLSLLLFVSSPSLLPIFVSNKNDLIHY